METYEVRMLEIIDLRIAIEAENEQEAQSEAYRLYPFERDRFRAVTIECDYVEAIRRLDGPGDDEGED